MATMTKAMMAKELDGLRHAVSQLKADNERLRAELDAAKAAPVVRCNGTFSNRRDAMAAARKLAMETGQSVKVQF